MPAFDIPKRFRNEVFVLIRTDEEESVEEAPREDNNVTAHALQVTPWPFADLVTSHAAAPDQVFDGAEFDVRYRVTNRGLGATDADAWTDTIWLTRDTNRPHAGAPGDPQDYLLARVSHDGILAVDQYVEHTVRVRLPERLSGQWHITPWSDAYDIVFEETTDIYVNPDDPNELDNNNYKARSITILATPPDLVVTDVQAPEQAVAGQPFTVRWTVKNQGVGPTRGASWGDRIYLSSHPDIRHPDAVTWTLHSDWNGRAYTGLLEVEQSYTVEETFLLSPEADGAYVIVETGAGLWEGPYGDNNSRSTATAITNPAADLQITEVVSPQNSFSGEPVTVSWTVTNLGEDVWSGTRFWREYVYLSRDARVSEERATMLGEFFHVNDPPLKAGASYTSTYEVPLPAGADGDYFLYVFTDPLPLLNVDDFDPRTLPQGDNSYSRSYYDGERLGAVYEGGLCRLPGPCEPDPEGNNFFRHSVQVAYREPNLAVAAFSPFDRPVKSGQWVEAAWTVSNVGTRATRETSWVDRVYLSRDGALDSLDWLLGDFAVEMEHGLAAGASYDRNLQVRIPDGIQGEFQLLLFADSNLVSIGDRLTYEYEPDLL